MKEKILNFLRKKLNIHSPSDDVWCRNNGKSFSYWLLYEAKDCGVCDPPLEAQLALDFLSHYLLGDDWYVNTSESTIQVNSAIVYNILKEYSPEFRKEQKRYMRWRNEN